MLYLSSYFAANEVADSGMADDDDLNLPRAAVNKLIKETLPQVSYIISLCS